MKHFLEIPNWRPHTANELMEATTRSYHQAARMKVSDVQMISAYANIQKIPKAEGKRRVTIIYTQHKGRSVDGDSLYKSTLDALVNAKLLRDDNPTWCEHNPTELRRGKAKHTTIILEDL